MMNAFVVRFLKAVSELYKPVFINFQNLDFSMQNAGNEKIQVIFIKVSRNVFIA